MTASDNATVRRRIISSVARQSNITTDTTEFVLFVLAREIRYEVSRGSFVNFPDIGAWAPYVRKVRGRRGEGSSLRCTPRFSACRSFRQQVRDECPLKAGGAKRLRRHAINNAPSRGLRPAYAMLAALPEASPEEFRESITQQLLAPR